MKLLGLRRRGAELGAAAAVEGAESYGPPYVDGFPDIEDSLVQVHGGPGGEDPAGMRKGAGGHAA